MTAEAPAVTPCQLRVSAATSKRPLESLAMRSAASIPSPPVESSITRRRGSGSVPTRRSASASTGSDSIHELRCSTSRQAASIAATTRGWLCPTVAQIWPAVKSSTRCPSTVSTNDPDARATTPSTKSPP